jgi:hypothetical protein
VTDIWVLLHFAATGYLAVTCIIQSAKLKEYEKTMGMLKGMVARATVVIKELSKDIEGGLDEQS